MTVWRSIIRGAGLMVLFAFALTLIMACVFEVTHKLLKDNEEKEKLALLSEILPENSYDNNLLHSFIWLSEKESVPLGNRRPTQLYLAKKHDRIEAVIVEVTAKEGYGGEITLLLGIHRDGHVGAVRVLAHKETPGLGDYIEINKSRWILQFDGLAIPKPDSFWQVKKHGGEFEYMNGATISARAVIKAVHQATHWVMARKSRFFGEE